MGAITRGIANNILGNGAVDGTDALTGTIPATNIGNPSLANLTTFPPSVEAGIPQVAGDPPAPSDGDVWYNTNTYKLRVRGVSAALGSWATGGALNTSRSSIAGTPAGTQNAAMASSGAAPGAVTNVEQYDGTSWTEVADVNTARSTHGSSGTQTSSLIFGGTTPPSIAAAESWNGSSWTEVNDLNSARHQLAGFGADNTSALAVGGYSTPLSYTNITESWNGSSWTEVSDLNTARSGVGGTGIVTAGLAAGGEVGGNSGVTESWNGSSWTEVSDLNTARREYGIFGGEYTKAIVAGGVNASPGTRGEAESWDGTSWTEVNDLNESRYQLNNSGAGSGNTAGLVVGGQPTYGPPPATVGSTEEWNGAVANLNVDLA